MSGDRIELTDAEQMAAVSALRASVQARISDDDYGLLASAIDAVNRIRSGDPLGTVRASSDGVMLLIRVNVNEPECSTTYVRRWVIVNLRSGATSLSDEDYPPPDWPIVYTPEVS